MIAPDQRSTLTEALQPPDGYRFDFAVATTYSLSLSALLGLPAHMSLVAGAEDSADEDPLRMMEGLRRASSRIAVFCEKGRMEAPSRSNALAVLAEGMVHEVKAPHDGAFHPKIWAVRYAHRDPKAKQRVRTRLLVLTRNLTWDRCWDVSLCLEGIPRRGKVAGNKGLEKFLRWLPHEGAVRPLSAERIAMIEAVADDIGRSDWELPAGFDALEFHVLGTGAYRKPWCPLPLEGKTREALLVSPFIRADALRVFQARCAGPLHLVSRADELQRVDATVLEAMESRSVLKDEAGLAEGEEEGQASRLQGLHAKLAVFTRGRRVHVAMGSANFTDAVVISGKNVEVVAELSGGAKQVGTPQDWLGKEGLGPLLDAYVAPEDGPDADQLEIHALEKLRDDLRRAVVDRQWSLFCTPREGGAWQLTLRATDGLALPGAQLQAWPLTVERTRARPVRDGVCALDAFAPHEVTALVGFELTLDSQRARDLHVPAANFALEVTLVDAPDDRGDALMAHLLSKDGAFLDYLGILLDDATTAGGNGRSRNNGRDRNPFGGHSELPLFEQIVRAFSRDRSRLASLDTVVQRLKHQTIDGKPCLPEGFEPMWAVIGAALKLEKRK